RSGQLLSSLPAAVPDGSVVAGACLPERGESEPQEQHRQDRFGVVVELLEQGRQAPLCQQSSSIHLGWAHLISREPLVFEVTRKAIPRGVHQDAVKLGIVQQRRVFLDAL